MRFIGAIVILLFVVPTYAQEFPQLNDTLTEETNKLIPLCAMEEVGMFTNYLADIANKNLPIKDRYCYKDIALTLFIGGGKDYNEYILDNDGSVIDTISRKAVTMEVTSLRRGTKRKWAMSRYLQGLADIRYKEITVQTTELHDMRVSDIRKLDDGKYECTIYYDQVYILKGADIIPGKIDRTRKRAVCYIDIVQTDDGLEILCLLGNVTAIETSMF